MPRRASMLNRLRNHHAILGDEWEKNMENTCLILFDVVSRNICLKAPLHIPYHTIMYHLFTVLVFLRGSYRAWHGSREIAHQRDHTYIMLLEYPFGLRSPRVAKKKRHSAAVTHIRELTLPKISETNKL